MFDSHFCNIRFLVILVKGPYKISRYIQGYYKLTLALRAPAAAELL
jgi:hypothetical protein